MTMKKLVLIAVAASALSLVACSKKPPKDLPPPPVGAPGANSSATVPPPMPQGPVPGSRDDFLAKVAADRVFFDTNRSDLDETARSTLDSQAKWLLQYPAVRITIEGHCDERGTREYNLALGERRANAAKNYLVAAGVNVARINTISYGKERPAVLGSNEAAWAKNRRAVTVTLN
ncbi:MAG: peptidoglycan-associated lipoprotein Pal [Alphaproteobacteria bacterium]|nr:peptidoglycan-associated lipoprotein Pal [Alphaproteobacteria bacterium]MDE2041504.1 peptidoglycan-associated lipoprotein Pal [Alphaproteobacteria bacterium]MDE2341739.1 peptidoglycan-associated lipoprotein Pal [Alphaproteobacteria bacterium]